LPVACCLLVVGTTLLHYEALRIPDRTKLLVVILAMLLAHAAVIALYGIAFYKRFSSFGAGNLSGATAFSLSTCMYFSAETYTSLGFRDLTPTGPVRLLAGVEALNGLLLIGWSASFTYLSMERFWVSKSVSPT
jgi:Ion channel